LGEEAERDRDFATTLAKGLAVLETFRPDRTRLSNSEIAGLSGISRPTVARLTYTLERLGYLKQEKSKFRLSWRGLMLVNPLLANFRLLHIARPLMQKLASDVGGTVSIGVRDGTKFVYLETARVNENIWSSPDLGTVGPLLPATIGQALCAQLPDAELAPLLQQLRAEHPDLWERYSPAFTKGLSECRERGFSISRGEWIPSTHSTGVPLLRDQDGECFAMNCRVPIYRLTANQIEDEIAPRLKSLADHLRSQLSLVMPIASVGRTQRQA
jgi:DNA-binding IclR family transcriptional regulator